MKPLHNLRYHTRRAVWLFAYRRIELPVYRRWRQRPVAQWFLKRLDAKNRYFRSILAGKIQDK